MALAGMYHLLALSLANRDSFNLEEYAKHIFGINPMKIPGIGGNAVL
jgi:hypothetical protein